MTNFNPFSLEGKSILVTGASSGIGKATAIECSKLGAHLIVTGRNEERLNQTLAQLEGDGHKAIPGDLTDEDDLKNLLKNIDKINGAVLCAGINDCLVVQFSSVKKFQKIFDTNLFSQTETVRLLVKGKKLEKGASIVAISSVAAFTHELGNGVYGAAKSALSTWIKYAAYELGSKGYRLNCICPGMVNTPLIQGGEFTDEQLAENMKEYVLQRYGEPEEIAYGAIYLLSDASAWITGIDLKIDGGYTL